VRAAAYGRAGGARSLDALFGSFDSDHNAELGAPEN
jgi:hypothetical protein